MSKKHPAKSLRICAVWLQPAANPEQVSWAMWLKNVFPRAPRAPATPPLLVVPTPLKSLKRMPRPPYKCPLGCVKLQAQAQTGWCQNGVYRGQKIGRFESCSYRQKREKCRGLVRSANVPWRSVAHRWVKRQCGIPQTQPSHPQ